MNQLEDGHQPGKRCRSGHVVGACPRSLPIRRTTWGGVDESFGSVAHRDGPVRNTSQRLINGMVFPHGQVAQYHPYNLLKYGA